MAESYVRQSKQLLMQIEGKLVEALGQSSSTVCTACVGLHRERRSSSKAFFIISLSNLERRLVCIGGT